MTQNFIPLSVPNFKGNELAYVTHAINTEWVSTGGHYINEFETKISAYVKCEGAVACQSGTAGLHVALQVCGILSGDEVIVPTLTFIAAVNPIKYLGATPIFMDCDESLCIDVTKIQNFIENECDFVEGRVINKSTNRQVKAILVVHVFGNMADMESIMKIANLYHLRVIEDATEALGTHYIEGVYKGLYAGTIGDIGVFSFNGNKIITTGGGGMIVSKDNELLKRSKHLTTQAKTDEVHFIHDEIGYNYRMTNLQAALGLAQLEQLETFISIKRENFYFYKTQLQGIEGLSLLDFDPKIRPNYWFYSLYVMETYPLNKEKLIEFLALKNIQARPIWGLISDQKPYQSSQTYNIEKAKTFWEHVVNIPCSSNLTKEDASYVVACLKSQISV